MENRTHRIVLLGLSLSLFFFGLGCGHDAKKNEPLLPHHANPADTGEEPVKKSDFTQEYRQQVDQVDVDAEEKRKSNKRRDKRVDEMINRDDRRQK